MDYDSARHHYESLQTAKKKDEAKIAKVRAGGRGWGRVFRGVGTFLLCCAHCTPLPCGLSLLPCGWNPQAPCRWVYRW